MSSFAARHHRRLHLVSTCETNSAALSFAPLFFAHSAPIMEKQHSHRPSQKQANKPFKSKHASKSIIRDAKKGRTSSQKLAASTGVKKATNASVEAAFKKANRKHHAKQMQGKKLAALAEVGALFNRKGSDRVQRVIAVVPLTSDVSALQIVEQLLEAVGVECRGDGGFRTGE